MRPCGSLDQRRTAPADALLRGARVLDPRSGIDAPRDIVVRGGQVAELGEPGSLEAPDECEVVEAEGLHAFPAFTDPHVHLRTPGREDEEDIDSGTRAAAAGGFCAIIAMPNTDPAVDCAPVLSSLRERARAEAHVPVGFTAAITRGRAGKELTEMAELADAGAVGFTDDGGPVHDAGVLRQALQYQRLSKRTLALHEEDPFLSRDGVMNEGAVSALLGLSGQPAVAESTMIQRDAALARFEDGAIHVQHVSARESIEAIEIARDQGVHISAEACPHHLCFTEDAVRSLDPERFKMNPPLRAEADRQAMIDGLRRGVLDCVATDHAPHSREEKEQPFEAAPFGVTGLETAFAALHTELVLPGVLELPTLVERMTSGMIPFGFAAPAIEPGATANIVLADLAADWEVGEAGYESRSSNCAFAGRTLTGRVRMTIAAGAVAYRERSFAIGAVS